MSGYFAFVRFAQWSIGLVQTELDLIARAEFLLTVFGVVAVFGDRVGLVCGYMCVLI